MNRRKRYLTTMRKKLDFLNQAEKKAITSFVTELKKKLGDDLVAIRLFGSKVRGDFKGDSDIDIFITVKEKNQIIRDILSEIEVDWDIKYNIPISTVLYSLSEYEKNKELKSFFFENVEKEGIML